LTNGLIEYKKKGVLCQTRKPEITSDIPSKAVGPIIEGRIVKRNRS
jgi:hypothetical protein